MFTFTGAPLVPDAAISCRAFAMSGADHVVPGLFVIFAGLLLVSTVVADPRDTALGAGLLLTGVPAYLFFRKMEIIAMSHNGLFQPIYKNFAF